MSPTPAIETRERRIGSWLDDLAAIVANWLDRHPVRRRLLLLLVAVLSGSVVISRGALYPVAVWVAVSLILLLAREVARVTRVPGDHQIRTDYERDPRGSQQMR